MEREIDANEARRRCIQAMAECEDVDTRFALWRAATRYAKLARENGGAGAAVTLAGQPLNDPKRQGRTADW